MPARPPIRPPTHHHLISRHNGQLAADRGVRVLYLHVDVRNEAAIRLYLRAGFQRVEETMETFEFASALGLLSGKNGLKKDIFSLASFIADQ